jgi:hypothetical protein
MALRVAQRTTRRGNGFRRLPIALSCHSLSEPANGGALCRSCRRLNRRFGAPPARLVGITQRSAYWCLSPPRNWVFTTSTNGTSGRPGRPICPAWLPRQRRQRRRRRQASHSGPRRGHTRPGDSSAAGTAEGPPRRVPSQPLTGSATCSPRRAVDGPSGHRPVLSFRSCLGRSSRCLCLHRH